MRGLHGHANRLGDDSGLHVIVPDHAKPFCGARKGGPALDWPIALEEVTKSMLVRREAVALLDHLSLRIEPGEIYGLLGHNGAGKTTLIKLLLGLMRPTRGRIWLAGVRLDVGTAPSARRTVGYMPEILNLYKNLTGLQVLRFFADLRGRGHEAILPLAERFGMDGYLHRRLGTYSKGMLQRVGLVQALMGRPQVLILDEPFNGLDPEGLRLFLDVLAEEQARGCTILLTSHILPEIQHRVGRVGFLLNGRLVAEGRPADLAQRYGLRVTIRARIGGGGDAVPTGLAAQEAAAGSDGWVAVTCDAGEKVRALRRMLAEDTGIDRVHVSEPSLMDIYMAASRAPGESER